MSINISLMFVPKGHINNILTLVQLMAYTADQATTSIWTNDGKFTDAYVLPSFNDLRSQLNDNSDDVKTFRYQYCLCVKYLNESVTHR